MALPNYQSIHSMGAARAKAQSPLSEVNSAVHPHGIVNTDSYNLIPVVGMWSYHN